MNRKLRMGMIGGGTGAFIGNVHRIAAVMDNEIELVCGAFNSDASRSKESGQALYLPEKRVYNNYAEMILSEKKLSTNEIMYFVAIVTPNHIHYHPAKLALENGFHVICDKPVTINLQEVNELEKIIDKTGLLFAVTHAYTGYPMIKEARSIIRSGRLGKIRKVNVIYPQGWLSELIEANGQKQALWRTDPSQSGVSCTMGDIGVHAFNLAEYITGMKVTEICADISTFVEGRLLDDDGSVLWHFDNGTKGILAASQISAGAENDISISIYGKKGGLTWKQEDCNSLNMKWNNKATEIIRTGMPNLSESALAHSRVPSGHPEGYLEAFANIYRNFAFAIKNHFKNEQPSPLYDYPNINDGVRGMTFIEKVIESGESQSKWTSMA